MLSGKLEHKQRHAGAWHRSKAQATEDSAPRKSATRLLSLPRSEGLQTVLKLLTGWHQRRWTSTLVSVRLECQTTCRPLPREE